MLLNTPSGIVNLATGDLLAHDPERYCSKTTTVGPGGECPKWLAFLDRVAAGDAELILNLQRLAGYILTGSTREHALFFLYGLGANGKSVFVETLRGIMGDYAVVAPIETFTEARGERHPTELAGLRGARVVVATETEAGRAWSESRLKTLTGGDRIAARYMRGDFFEFDATFKLLISGNYRPRLRSVDEAIRRRLHLFPFTVTIPPEDRDEHLSEKLAAEAGGILAWAIAGAIEWGGLGLQPCEAVRAATEEYLQLEDRLHRWIEDECQVGAALWCRASDLFASWATWAEKNGESVGSTKAFGQRLEARGLERARGKDTSRGYAGIALLNPKLV